MSTYAIYLAFSIQVIERKSNKQNVPHTFEFSCQSIDGEKKLYIETLPFQPNVKDFKPLDFNFKNIGSRRKEKFVICESFYKAKGLNHLGDIFFAVNTWVSEYVNGTKYICLDEVGITAHLYETTTQKSEKIQITVKRENQRFVLYPILNSNKSDSEVFLEKNLQKETRNNLELKVTENFFIGRNFIGVTDIDRAVQAVREWMHVYMHIKYESKANLPEKVCTI